MKIAIFDAAPYWSGGAERVYFCCRELKKLGHKIILCCLPTSRLNILLKDTVEIYNINPKFDIGLWSIFKVARIIINQRINILDVHSPKFYWICLLVSKIFNKKIIITRNVIYRKKGLKKIINKYLYKNCDHIITVSGQVKEVIVKDFKVEENKITTIYDCVNKKEFSENERLEIRDKIRGYYQIGKDTILLAIIARIEKIKGHDLVLKTVKMLIDKKIKVKLIIIGKEEDKIFCSKLKEYIKENKLENYIFFVGFKDNIEDYLIASDIIVSSSYFESMGKSILEGLFYNKPFVATKVGGLMELISEDYGIFVDAGDYMNLYSGILKVISNYGFYANNICNMNKEIFSVSRMVKEYEIVYKKIFYEK